MDKLNYRRSGPAEDSELCLPEIDNRQTGLLQSTYRHGVTSTDSCITQP